MSVLFFEDIGFARLNVSMKNARQVHPIVSKEIVQYAGIDNKLILESILQHEEKLDGSGYPFQLTKIHEYAQISQIVNQYSELFNKSNKQQNIIGELILLGQQFNFRNSNINKTVYNENLQMPLIKIMQERLQTQQQIKDYAFYLHQELSNIVKWANIDSIQDVEITAIKRKIKSSLWIDQYSTNPFQIEEVELQDTQLSKGFITDAMRFIYSIAESANYLNCVLHNPIQRGGFPVSAEQYLRMANPLNY